MVLLATVFGTLALTIQAQQTRFDIWKGNDIVGSILAKRMVSDERTRYLLTSYTEINAVLKQAVRTTVAVEYRHGNLSTSFTHLYVNDVLRDSSHFTRGEEEASCYVYPDDRFRHQPSVQWTTARMYFEEPTGQHSIFVESIMKPCPLQALGLGYYRLTLPGGKVNTYMYMNGRLEEIHVDRSFLDLVFKRDE